MAISDDDTDRLNLLNHRLADLVTESRHLRERWTDAAADVKMWPDVARATQLFGGVPHVREQRGTVREWHQADVDRNVVTADTVPVTGIVAVQRTIKREI